MKFKKYLYIILISILTIFLCIFHNAPFIYGQIANFYFKNNNIKQAQLFFEKSFILGNTNLEQRNVYVNSLINSPLSINSQKKLVKLAEDDIQDSASLKAQKFLENLRIEINKKYPNNYIQQAPYNQKILRWNHFPISYRFENSNNIPKYFIEEIEKAILTWERNGQIMLQETSNKDANIIICFKSQKSEDLDYGKKYVVAYTVPNVENNDLKNMVINFYLRDPNGEFFTSNQIYNTALHEIFHALGFLGHSYEKNDIMYLSKDNTTLLEDSRENLSEADIATMQLLYKIEPEITTKNSDTKIESEYIPYVVLGNSQDVTDSKKQEARNYIYYAPSLPAGYIDLAESLVAEERYEEAIKNLEKALYLADTDEIKYIVYYNLAVTYYYIDYAELALMYLKKAFEIKEDESLLILKAEIFIKDNQLDNAIEQYQYLIKNSPENLDYVVNCAKLYIKNNERIKARQLLKGYKKQHPEHKQDKRLSQFGILSW